MKWPLAAGVARLTALPLATGCGDTPRGVVSKLESPQGGADMHSNTSYQPSRAKLTRKGNLSTSLAVLSLLWASRGIRSALIMAASAAWLAVGVAPALAATAEEEDQAVTAVTNRLVEQAKTKLRGFGGGLKVLPADAIEVPAGSKVTAQVKHDEQGGEELSGKIFLDTVSATVGELAVIFPAIGFLPRDPVTGIPLGSEQAVLEKVTDSRNTVLFRPPFYQAGTTKPAAIQRRIDARVPMQLDLPRLDQLASSMSSQLGGSSPDNAQRLVAFVFDHLTPAGYSVSDGLCKFLPREHPRYCGRGLISDTTGPLPVVSDVEQLISNLTDPDPDPSHSRLFARIQAIDVESGATEVVRNINSGLLKLQPLDVISVSAWFRHADYARSSETNWWPCKNGFALLVVPSGTPGAASVEWLIGSLNTLRNNLAKLTALTGMAPLPGAVDTLMNSVSRIDQADVKVRRSPIANLGETEMVSCNWLQKIHAEDQISSALAFGLPGGKWRGFVDRDFSGSFLTIAPDKDDWLQERKNMHRESGNFGDKLSSLEFDDAPPQ